MNASEGNEPVRSEREEGLRYAEHRKRLRYRASLQAPRARDRNGRVLLNAHDSTKGSTSRSVLPLDTLFRVTARDPSRLHRALKGLDL